MEQMLIDCKKQALIEAKADISKDSGALHEFLDEDDHLSEEAKAAHEKAQASYKVVNLLRAIAIAATIIGLVNFTLASQPNMVLMLLIAFAAGFFYNIQRP